MTALGMPPTPICSVAPSGISDATKLPIFVSISLGTGVGTSTNGTSPRHMAVILLTWMTGSPNVRGMYLFTCAITTFEHSAPEKAMSAEIPNEQYPSSSGSLTFKNVTSTGICRLRKRKGTSPKNAGIVSATPSRIALRSVFGTKIDSARKESISSRLAYGASSG